MRGPVGLALASVRGHHFLTVGLDAGAVVVDLGAHRGEFSAELVRRFACRCIAVEPVATLIGAATDPRVEVLHAAIAPVDGPVVLHLKRNPEASTLLHSAEAGAGELTVPGITWSSLRRQARLAEIALLKVDIEGAELEVLGMISAAELRQVAQLTVEFHPDVTGVAEVRNCVARLESAGFWTVRFSRGYGDVLFVNRAVLRLTLWQRLWLQHVVRNWLGCKRIVRRWTGRAP